MYRSIFRVGCAVATIAALVGCSATPETASGSQSANLGSTPNDHRAAAIAPGTEDDLRTNVGDRVFFTKGSSDITAEGRITLERQGEWLARYPNVKVIIEGYCDERGTREFNLGLGERRAHVVKMVLMAEGIASSRLTTISYGKERPAALGSDEAAWAQNRRVVTVIN